MAKKTILQLALGLLSLFCANMLHAVCSPYLGLASINEVSKDRPNGRDNPADFIEIRLLDADLDASIFTPWTVEICLNDVPFTIADDCRTVSLGDYDDTTPPWLVDRGLDIAPFIDFNAGFNIILRDAAGDTIDYLDFDSRGGDSFTVLEDTTCTDYLFDTSVQHPSSGQSVKRIRRRPDGTGDWDTVRAQSDGGTDNAVNDSVAPGTPTLSIDNIEILAGDAAVFTLTLSSAFSEAVTFTYETRDGTATVGDGDYTAAIGTGTIAAGSTTAEITVPTSASAAAGEFFYLIIGGVNNVFMADQVATATIVDPLHHFRIFHSGTMAICESTIVTITAHSQGHQPVDNSGNTIRVTATSDTPDWVAGDVTWAVGATATGSYSLPENGVIEYQFGPGEAAVDLVFSNLSTADIDFNVTNGDGSITESSTEDPILSVDGVAMRFYYDGDGDNDADFDASGAPVNIPEYRISGDVSEQLILRVVETDADTGACIPRVIGDQTVEMAYQCNDPDTCIRDRDMNVISGGTVTAIEENDLATGTTDFAPLTMTFDGEAEAPFNVQYFDVGEVQLFARFRIPATSTEPEILLFGFSPVLVFRPSDFVITSVVGNSGEANPGTTAAGDGFVAAESLFTVNVEVRNSVGGLTPNYGNENLAAEGLEINIIDLVMPSDPAANRPALQNPLAFTATTTPGEFSNNTLSWPEAGTITANITVADGNYFGAGEITGTTSGNIGRFYPDHFRIITNELFPGCVSGNFSYMSDQIFSYTPLDAAVEINAEGAADTVLQNYDTSLGYPTESFLIAAENDNNGLDLTARTALISSPDWEAGVFTVSGGDNLGFRRNLNGLLEQPDGPLNNLQFGLQPAGDAPDDVTFVDADLDMLTTDTNDCSADGNCNAASIGGPQTLFFGRLKLENRHGPETSPLSVPLVTEYWNGIDFVINTADNCTRLMLSDIRFDGDALSDDTNRTVDLNSGSTTGSFTDFISTSDMNFVDGDAGLIFSAPGAGNTGSFLVSIDLSNYPWLRGDWNQDGDYGNDISVPDAEISFGRYRGHDRIIFWREVLD